MQFIVIAYDGTDGKALERRMAVRPDHLRQAEKFHESGQWLYAAGVLNDGGDLIGSVIVCNFPSKEELQREWLDHEPYILGKVWERIDIHPARIPPFYLGRRWT
jgi:uncharacterized protein YciI